MFFYNRLTVDEVIAKSSTTFFNCSVWCMFPNICTIIFITESGDRAYSVVASCSFRCRQQA